MIAVLVTLMVPIAVLLLLLSFATTAAFTARVPGGSDAMGLIVPFACSALGALLLVLATAMCAGAHALDWISPQRGNAAWVAMIVALGLALASVGILIAWAERMGSWVSLLGWLPGAVAPIALATALLISVWTVAPRPQWANLLQACALVCALVAVAGYGLAVNGLRSWHRQSSENARRAAESAAASEAEWARKRARSPIEAAREDFANYSDSAPLWTITAGLPDTDDPEVRRFIIARALKVPEFENDLSGNLGTDHPRYRHGALDLVRFVPESDLRTSWAPMVERSIRVSTQEIAARTDWLTPDDFSNPDPLEHVRAMVGAARRFPSHAGLERALADLRVALESLPESAQRTQALAW